MGKTRRIVMNVGLVLSFFLTIAFTGASANAAAATPTAVAVVSTTAAPSIQDEKAMARASSALKLTVWYSSSLKKFKVTLSGAGVGKTCTCTLYQTSNRNAVKTTTLKKNPSYVTPWYPAGGTMHYRAKVVRGGVTYWSQYSRPDAG